MRTGVICVHICLVIKYWQVSGISRFPAAFQKLHTAVNTLLIQQEQGIKYPPIVDTKLNYLRFTYNLSHISIFNKINLSKSTDSNLCLSFKMPILFSRGTHKADMKVLAK